MAITLELSILLVIALGVSHAHPAGLSCATDEQTATEKADVLRVGATIMQMNVSASSSVSLSAVPNPNGLTISMANLPPAAYYAIRASGQSGSFLIGQGQNVTSDCASQLYSTTAAANASSSASWSGDDVHTDVTFTVVWSEGPGNGIFLTSLEAASLEAVSAMSTSMAKTNVTVSVELLGDQMQITLVGSATEWYGVGFGADSPSMKGYAIVVDETGGLHELNMGGKGVPGSEIPGTALVLQNNVKAGVRTMVLSRAMHAGVFNFASADFKTGLAVSSAFGGIGAKWSAQKMHVATDVSVLKEG